MRNRRRTQLHAARYDHDRLGTENWLRDALAALGDRIGAVRRYRQSLPIAEKLARANPSHPGLQRDAEITRLRLAELDAGGRPTS